MVLSSISLSYKFFIPSPPISFLRNVLVSWLWSSPFYCYYLFSTFCPPPFFFCYLFLTCRGQSPLWLRVILRDGKRSRKWHRQTLLQRKTELRVSEAYICWTKMSITVRANFLTASDVFMLQPKHTAKKQKNRGVNTDEVNYVHNFSRASFRKTKRKPFCWPLL